MATEPIIHIAGELAPHGKGGIANAVAWLADRLWAAGRDTEVLVVGEDERSWPQPYPVHTIGARLRVAGNPLSPRIRRAVRAAMGRAAVVHGHSHLLSGTFLAATLRRRSSTPLVVTMHGLDSQTAPGWLNRAWAGTGTRYIARRADRIICLKQQDRQRVLAMGVPDQKVVVIPNAIDTEGFAPGGEPRPRRILFVGRLVAGKGVLHLIDAAAQLDGIELHVIGDGPQREEMLDRAERRGVDLVHESRVTAPGLVQAYRQAAVFCLPSRSEGLPLTLLEAMACGTPAIVHTSLAPEVAGTGWTTQFADPGGLADIIQQALAEASEERRERCRQTVLARYRPEAVLAAHLALYDALLDAPT